MKRRYRAVLGALAGALVLIVSGCVSQVASPSAQTESAGATNVYTTARVGNVLIIGGNFTRVYSPDFKGIRGAGGLAAINATTGQWIWSARACPADRFRWGL